MQKWKQDANLYDAPTELEGKQLKKKLDYEKVYIKEFLDSDPIQDWDSFDRCKFLWNWCLDKIDIGEVRFVLDCGTKDAKFPAWLRDEEYFLALGIELSESYIKYAVSKNRPIRMENVCEMTFADEQFDFVFSHHLHGLTPDYMKALDEMYRVSRKYMVALNQVPGNKRKHYSYIENADIFYEFIDKHQCKVLFNDYLNTGFENEWVIFVEKENIYGNNKD